MNRRHLHFAWVIPCLIGLVACKNPLPEKISINDPKVAPLLEAAEKIDRVALGFDLLPQSGDIRVEWAASGGIYDVMLHMAHHLIAFRKTSSGYEWIWEQEIYEGPKQYSTPDGMMHEDICITYQIVELSGVALNTPVVDYTGPDTRLVKDGTLFNWNMPLSAAIPIIQEWKTKAAEAGRK